MSESTGNAEYTGAEVAIITDLRAENARLTQEVAALRKRDEYPILVVCALIVQDGQVLLERHAPADGRPGYVWDIPGGKVEKGEMARDALVREIREEMAVEIRVDEMMPDLSASVWDDKYCAHWQLATYECEIVSGTPPLSDELKWATLTDLTPEDVKEPDLTIIRDWQSRVDLRKKLAEAKKTCARCNHRGLRFGECGVCGCGSYVPDAPAQKGQE